MPRYGEQQQYAVGDWVEVRAAGHGRIIAASLVGGKVQYAVQCVGGSEHYGLFHTDLRPWNRKQ